MNRKTKAFNQMLDTHTAGNKSDLKSNQDQFKSKAIKRPFEDVNLLRNPMDIFKVNNVKFTTAQYEDIENSFDGVYIASDVNYPID